jgi:putative ABC transport system permease protein
MTFALTELRRARLRFGLLAAAVALLVFLVLFLATLGRTLLGFSTGALANTSADVLVYSATARRNLQASRLDPSVVGRVAGVAGVAAAAGVGQATVTADPGAGRGPVTLTLFGIRPGQPGTPAKLVAGRLPGPGEALVDRADAASGFRIGREVTLRPGGRRLRIVGYSRDSRYQAGPTAYTTLDEWRAVLRSGNPDATQVPLNLLAVRAAPGVTAATLTRRIDQAVAGIEALDRASAVAAIPGVELIAMTFDLLIGIAFAIAVLVVGCFFLIVTVQKLHVLRALRALGAATGWLARSLLAQVTVLVVAGVALATAALALAAASSGPSFPIAVDPALVGEVLAATLGCSLAAAVLPIRRIAGLDPAAATHSR